jgi:carbohydrate kinase of FGGY family protein
MIAETRGARDRPSHRRLETPSDLIVEGGFNRTPAYAGVLKALLPDRNVVIAPPSSGAATGAALLAHWASRASRPDSNPRASGPLRGCSPIGAGGEGRL